MWRRFRECFILVVGALNVEIIRSFYLEPVYRLIPVFNPFSMSTLLVRCLPNFSFYFLTRVTEFYLFEDI